MAHFTPFSALLGGTLIGLAVALLLVGTGRVAGISGIAGGLVEDVGGDRAWRVAFLFGLAAGGVAMLALHPEAFGGQVPRSSAALAAAGLLVGFGTRLGGGCTSGHGVCGISRGAVRSVVATVTFMVTAALVVWGVRRFFGGAL